MFPPSTTSNIATSNIHIVYAKVSLKLVRTGFGWSCCSPQDEQTKTKSLVPSVLVWFSPSLFLVLKTGPLSTTHITQLPYLMSTIMS